MGVVAGRQLILSAPHNAEHTRDGQPKRAEPGTGPLARSVARSLKSSVLWTEGRLDGDPNWDPDHPYLETLESLLVDAGSFVMDIHTMRSRGFDVCLGLGVLPERIDGAWQIVIEELVRRSLTVSVNWPFAAGPRTVTSQLQVKSVPCLQIELSTECFDPGNEKHRLAEEAVTEAGRRIVDLGVGETPG